MAKHLIFLGDRTDHGGVVISASEHTIRGRAIARKGDMVDCPMSYPGGAPHGKNAIVEGCDAITIDDVPVALEGHHTECGCALIASMPDSVG